MTQALHVNGVDLEWSERGRGADATPAFVLCHGFTGSAHDFALVVDDLATAVPGRRVVTLDQRGHGCSTRTGTLQGYTIEQLVADLTAFIEKVGGGPVDLLGHSMGGRVALGLVLGRPDLVSSLILMDTSAWSFMPPDEGIREMVHEWITAFDPAQGMPVTMSLGSPEDTLIEQTTPGDWQRKKEAVFAGMDAYAVKAFGVALLADVADGVTSLRSELPSITCPTTVIVGQHDHPLVDQAPDLAAEVADGRLSVIAGAYHSPQLTHRDTWLATVEAHLHWADESRATRADEWGDCR
jgi:pimeloyl-ACP methyl ester carboxylesterase